MHSLLDSYHGNGRHGMLLDELKQELATVKDRIESLRRHL
jgi:hypothetical protein